MKSDTINSPFFLFVGGFCKPTRTDSAPWVADRLKQQISEGLIHVTALALNHWLEIFLRSLLCVASKPTRWPGHASPRTLLLMCSPDDTKKRTETHKPRGASLLLRFRLYRTKTCLCLVVVDRIAAFGGVNGCRWGRLYLQNSREKQLQRRVIHPHISCVLKPLTSASWLDILLKSSTYLRVLGRAHGWSTWSQSLRRRDQRSSRS